VRNGKICVAFRNPHPSLQAERQVLLTCRRVVQHRTAQGRGMREPPKGCIYTLQTPTYSPSHVSSPAGRLVLLFRGVSSPEVFAQLTCGRARHTEATGTQDRRLGSALPPNPSKASSVRTPIHHRLPKTTNYPYHPSSITIPEWTTNSGKYCPQLPCAALILLCLPRLSRPPPRSPSDPTPSSRSERSLLRNLKIHHPLPYFLTCAISLHLEPWHLQPCTDIPAPKLQSLPLHAQAGPRASAVISLQPPALLPFRYPPTYDLRLPTLPPPSPRR
jgi:hypothetical protein